MKFQAAKMPYFDALLGMFELGDRDFLTAMGHHTHWGYWEEPGRADGSVSDFAIASDRLAELVCDAAGVSDSMQILDVGCGFGGNIADMNQRHQAVQLTGLNIDPRQIARAKTEVHARPGNTVEFVEGNACHMPFSDHSFDAITAVESPFHFPSRTDFLREAHRVLRPGGKLGISDFVPRAAGIPGLALLNLSYGGAVKRVFGDTRITLPETAYVALGRRCGFEKARAIDITRNTLPTYPMLLELAYLVRARNPSLYTVDNDRVTRFMARMSRIGWLRYLLFSMER
jgi:SAM-dependent methyltransferase